MDTITNISEIQNTRGRTDRFSYFKGEFKGRHVFVKRVISPELRGNLERELIWAEFMQHVETTDNKSDIVGPRVLDQPDEDTLIFEFIDSEHLSEQNELSPWVNNLDRYVDMLILFDENAKEWQSTKLARRGATRSEGWAHRPIDWLGDNSIRVERLQEAATILTNARPGLSFCMQHGDLTPWQIFVKANKWIVIDGEHSGTDLPRFNDLAYAYGRLSTILRSPKSAAMLLQKFIEKARLSHEEIENQLLPVMLCGSIWMLGDAFNDEQSIDYIAEATRYLDKCLEQNIDTLLPA